MAEIVNLRQARKRAARGKSEAAADANRTAFGLPKQLRSAAKAEQARLAAELDGRLLEGRGAMSSQDRPDTSKARGPSTDQNQPRKAPAVPDGQ
jgi:hypothetical protein